MNDASQKVFNGHNLTLLQQYPDNYFDSIVTDPPYGLGDEPNAEQMLQAWITNGYLEVSGSGFMGKEWDAFVPQPIFWKEAFRVLKHGGHVVSFFGTRTYDWGVMAMRLAGFEIRDCIQWLYGSGFPKSHNISKAIDKMYGAEREVIGKNNYTMPKADNSMGENSYAISGGKLANGNTAERIIGNITAPATDQAKEWEGWGTALKPANEPIVLARKPLEKGLSIAENVLKWGTGGINIDGCRIGVENRVYKGSGIQPNKINNHQKGDTGIGMMDGSGKDLEFNVNGRFPANLIMTHHPDCVCVGTKKVGTGKDGGYNYQGNTYEVAGFVPNNSPAANSNYGQETIENWNCHEDCPIKIMDEQSGVSKSSKSMRGSGGGGDKVQQLNYRADSERGHNDKGGASRFFYCAKTSKSERNKGLNGFEIKQTIGGGVLTSVGDAYGSIKAPNQNFHPTVKPVALMRYLVRLVTPPNGIVLDPFNGSGTTGIACKLEEMNYVGLELDAEYCKIAQSRIDNFVWEDEEIELVEEQNDNINLYPKQLSFF